MCGCFVVLWLSVMVVLLFVCVALLFLCYCSSLCVSLCVSGVFFHRINRVCLVLLCCCVLCVCVCVFVDEFFLCDC